MCDVACGPAELADLRGILDALHEDADDAVSWAALADWGEERGAWKRGVEGDGLRAWSAVQAYRLVATESITAAVQLYAGYCEPGYTDPASGLIATGNWNAVTVWERSQEDGGSVRRVLDDSPAKLGTLLERLGVECEWADEWASCDECGKLVRTEPSGYDWTPAYTAEEGGIVCHECQNIPTRRGNAWLRERLDGPRCDSCQMVSINGVPTHETGCPDAWRDETRECQWCGSDFRPEYRGQRYCDNECEGADRE